MLSHKLVPSGRLLPPQTYSFLFSSVLSFSLIDSHLPLIGFSTLLQPQTLAPRTISRYSCRNRSLHHSLLPRVRRLTGDCFPVCCLFQNQQAIPFHLASSLLVSSSKSTVLFKASFPFRNKEALIDPAQGAGTTSVFKSCNFPSFLKDRFTERQCTNREMHTSQCTALWVVSNASSCVTTTTAKTYPQFYRLRLPQHLLCVNPSRAFWSVPANFVEIDPVVPTRFLILKGSYFPLHPAGNSAFTNY